MKVLLTTEVEFKDERTAETYKRMRKAAEKITDLSYKLQNLPIEVVAVTEKSATATKIIQSL